MPQIAGIKYETDAHGAKRYVRIDLKRYGNNELLEDFLDGLDAEMRRGGETITLDEFKKSMNNRLKKHV
jgi:hypothetical protein